MSDVELLVWDGVRDIEGAGANKYREPTAEELLNAAADKIDEIEEQSPLILPFTTIGVETTGVGAANLLRRWARLDELGVME